MMKLKSCLKTTKAHKLMEDFTEEAPDVNFASLMNGLGHTVSTQKTISQTDPAGSRYGPKRDGLVCAKPNRHVSACISGWGGRFELSFFALKPRVLACSFAYYKSYVFTNLIFTL